MKDDRIWERLYTIPQKAFSFHASQPVLLLRGLIFFALGLFGVFNPPFVLTMVTMFVGGVLVLFAVASFLMAGRGGRISTSLLLLFLVMGAIGVGMLVWPLIFDRMLMVVFGVWLIFTGVWGILSVQTRFGRFVLPAPGLVATLIGILLVVAPFIGVAAVSWIAALLMLLSGIEMLLLALGVDAGKWVISDDKHGRKK